MVATGLLSWVSSSLTWSARSLLMLTWYAIKEKPIAVMISTEFLAKYSIYLSLRLDSLFRMSKTVSVRLIPESARCRKTMVRANNSTAVSLLQVTPGDRRFFTFLLVKLKFELVNESSPGEV
jgi:hypothetical protein